MLMFDSSHLLEYSRGAQLLGSGGGGDSAIMKPAIAQLLGNDKSITIIEVEALSDEDIIVPIAIIGSPLIFWECPLNAQIFNALYDAIRVAYPLKNIVWMPAEIGGCNALTPILMSLLHGGKVLDADLIGRAFPKIQMCKPAVLNLPLSISYMSSIQGVATKIIAQDVYELEALARKQCVKFGGAALIATFIHTKQDARKYCLLGSISRALHLGEKFSNNYFGQSEFSGRITELTTKMQGGFVEGKVVITNNAQSCTVHFQNEFMVGYIDDKKFGSPDVIILLEMDSGLPLSVESLQYGIDVVLFLLRAPEFWYEPQYKNLVTME